jgi:hypothetical protein
MLYSKISRDIAASLQCMLRIIFTAVNKKSLKKEDQPLQDSATGCRSFYFYHQKFNLSALPATAGPWQNPSHE